MRKIQKTLRAKSGLGPQGGSGFYFWPAILVVLAAAGIGMSPANDRARAERLYREAWSHYSIRTESEMNTALAKAEQAIRACPDWVDPYVLVCELCSNISDRVPNTRKEWKLTMFARATAAGDQALALDPRNVGALYWRTLSLAGAADLRGWSENIWLYPTMRTNMDRIDVLDPHYYYGGTKRFWVEVLNRVPLLAAQSFGYDPEAIGGELAAEIRREPRYFCNYTYLARLYWKMGDKDRALRLLNYILRHDPFALYQYRGENIEHQIMACRLWKEYTGLDHAQIAVVASWSSSRSRPVASPTPAAASGAAFVGVEH